MVWAVLKDGVYFKINLDLKAMNQPGKHMKVMEEIKVGLPIRELGSNEAQPSEPSIKRYKS